ncbi:MAG: FkbM family methyltransferase [Solirubrobacteraceae bacterium]
MASSERLRAKLAIRTIALGRRLFANTPIQRLPITTAVLKRVFEFGYGDDEIDISFRGAELRVPAQDVTIVPGLVGGFYEEIELDLFEAVAAKSSLVVDVGGNVGVYACLAAMRMPTGRVVTFEPVPANLDYLERNVERNGVSSRVEIVGKAVSDAAARQPIFLADSIGTHSLSSVSADSKSQIEVDVTTLDAAVGDQPVDVLKIDIEGFDGHALKGAARLIESRRPTLFVEFVPRSLGAAGFSPEAMIGLVFDAYERVFVIDEPRGTVEQITQSQLLELAAHDGNRNLVAVSNPQHLEAIRTLLAERLPARSS